MVSIGWFSAHEISKKSAIKINYKVMLQGYRQDELKGSVKPINLKFTGFGTYSRDQKFTNGY